MKINYKVKTDKDFTTAIASVKAALAENKFGVLWELNLKDKLEEKGELIHNNFHVLEVCNPKKAKAVLDIDIEVGYFLPCKLVVYQDKHEVFIGMPKPTELIGLFNNQELVAYAEEVEAILIKAIESAK